MRVPKTAVLGEHLWPRKRPLMTSIGNKEIRRCRSKRSMKRLRPTDDCDRFPHARCLQALRSMATHLHRQTQSCNARRGRVEWSIQEWIPTISVNNKSNIALPPASSISLSRSRATGRYVTLSAEVPPTACRSVFVGTSSNVARPCQELCRPYRCTSLRRTLRGMLSICQRTSSDMIWSLDREIFRLCCASEWRLS